uniref:Uncharacterized protein n=1 Tax=Anguilla anguilla TaxID=7936 RepID=A0A0E9VA91_ANGAN
MQLGCVPRSGLLLFYPFAVSSAFPLTPTRESRHAISQYDNAVPQNSFSTRYRAISTIFTL